MFLISFVCKKKSIVGTFEFRLNFKVLNISRESSITHLNPVLEFSLYQIII